jgi:hypothetical protein
VVDLSPLVAIGPAIGRKTQSDNLSTFRLPELVEASAASAFVAVQEGKRLKFPCVWQNKSSSLREALSLWGSQLKWRRLSLKGSELIMVSTGPNKPGPASPRQQLLLHSKASRAPRLRAGSGRAVHRRHFQLQLLSPASKAAGEDHTAVEEAPAPPVATPRTVLRRRSSVFRSGASATPIEGIPERLYVRTPGSLLHGGVPSTSRLGWTPVEGVPERFGAFSQWNGRSTCKRPRPWPSSGAEGVDEPLGPQRRPDAAVDRGVAASHSLAQASCHAALALSPSEPTVTLGRAPACGMTPVPAACRRGGAWPDQLQGPLLPSPVVGQHFFSFGFPGALSGAPPEQSETPSTSGTGLPGIDGYEDSPGAPDSVPQQHLVVGSQCLGSLPTPVPLCASVVAGVSGGEQENSPAAEWGASGPCRWLQPTPSRETAPSPFSSSPASMLLVTEQSSESYQTDRLDQAPAQAVPGGADAAAPPSTSGAAGPPGPQDWPKPSAQDQAGRSGLFSRRLQFLVWRRFARSCAVQICIQCVLVLASRCT